MGVDIETGHTRLAKGLLSHALRTNEPPPQIVTSPSLAVKESRSLPDAAPAPIARKQQKRGDQQRSPAPDNPSNVDCMVEIRQILAQRESSRCLTFGCSPPVRSANPIASTIYRCAPKNAPERAVGFQSKSCMSPPAHA